MSTSPKPFVINGDAAFVLAFVLRKAHVVKGSLEESSYDVNGQSEPISGPQFLKALVAARLSAKDAEKILGIPYGTLIRKAAKLGTPFHSQRKAARRGPTDQPPDKYKELPKANPSAEQAKDAAVKRNTPKKVKAPPIEKLQAPATAKTLADLSYGECEKYVGIKDGTPVYCAAPAQEIPSRDGMIFRCAAHKTVGIKCVPSG